MKNKLNVLRILLSISESSGPFNQFTYPFSEKQNISLCVFKEPIIPVNSNIRVLYKPGNIFNFFFRVLRESKKEYDFIHIHHANLSILILAISLISNTKNTIFTLGTCYTNLKLRHRILLYISKGFFTNFICCSESVYKTIPKWFLSDNMSIIRHGVNIDRIKSSKKSNQIVIATRIIRQKNIEWVIRGFSESLAVDNYQLIIAGEGKVKSRLERLVQDLGLTENVIFLGSCSRDRVLSLMSESRFYISASESDGMPIAVLEAVASGSIPILLDTLPHLEVLNSGVFGFYFNDMEGGISSVISKAVEYNEKKLDLNSQNNIELSIKKFSVECMMKKYIELLD